MSERYLPGVPDQDAEADGDDDVDRHVISHVDIVVLEKKGKGSKKGNEHNEPEKGHPGAEELDILIVVPFHVHGRFLLYTVPERK